MAPFPMALNVFKVTPFFDAKEAYLTNDYRYGHSYYNYRRRMGNRT